VLQSVAECCSMLQCANIKDLSVVHVQNATGICKWQRRSLTTEICDSLQYVAVCCSMLQCFALCCSVLQCVAVCCSAQLS